MNIETIKNALYEIKNNQDDDEVQHSLEDKLLWDFVKHINESRDKYPAELRLMAAEILKSKDIKFNRWYA